MNSRPGDLSLIDLKANWKYEPNKDSNENTHGQPVLNHLMVSFIERNDLITILLFCEVRQNHRLTLR